MLSLQTWKTIIVPVRRYWRGLDRRLYHEEVIGHRQTETVRSLCHRRETLRNDGLKCELRVMLIVFTYTRKTSSIILWNSWLSCVVVQGRQLTKPSQSREFLLNELLFGKHLWRFINALRACFSVTLIRSSSFEFDSVFTRCVTNTWLVTRSNRLRVNASITFWTSTTTTIALQIVGVFTLRFQGYVLYVLLLPHVVSLTISRIKAILQPCINQSRFGRSRFVMNFDQLKPNGYECHWATKVEVLIGWSSWSS